MKKIKAFFSGLKARLLKWWTSTLIPVKRVVLLCSLLSLVAFGLGSCSNNNTFKTASADTVVTTRDDPAFLISTYTPSILYCSGNSASSFAAPASFYILDSGFGFCTGDYGFFNMLNTSNDTFTTDYSTVFYLVAPNAGVTVNFSYSAYTIRAYLSVSGIPNSWWGDFYHRCMRGEYNVLVDFYNNVISGSTAKSEALYNSSNYCRYTLHFNHKSDDNLSYTVDFFLSSFVNVPSSISSARFTNLPDLAGYNRIYYYFVNCSYTAVSAADSFESIYDTGYNTGYSVGYEKGLSETLGDISPWQILVNGVNSFFNAKIFGNISLGILLSVGLGIVLFTVFMHSLR